LEARIVSVADVYDALVTDRPYRKGHSEEGAFQIMSQMRGKELDPAIVDLFFLCQTQNSDSFQESKTSLPLCSVLQATG
jgi:HD-GYP domain-containing protein (c-di-GMP phosphodiesterase class II)